MTDFYQGDILKISGFRNKFVIVSKNAFIRMTNAFHVCPLLDKYPEGPIHIAATGKDHVAVHGAAVHSNENYRAYCGAGPVEFRTIRVARSRMEPMDT